MPVFQWNSQNFYQSLRWNNLQSGLLEIHHYHVMAVGCQCWFQLNVQLIYKIFHIAFWVNDLLAYKLLFLINEKSFIYIPLHLIGLQISGLGYLCQISSLFHTTLCLALATSSNQGCFWWTVAWISLRGEMVSSALHSSSLSWCNTVLTGEVRSMASLLKAALKLSSVMHLSLHTDVFFYWWFLNIKYCRH